MTIDETLPIENPNDETVPSGEGVTPIILDNGESEQSLQGKNPVDIDETVNEILSEEFQVFDPTVHAVDKTTGEPKRRGDGSFALKRGPKSGVKSASGPVPSKPKPETVQKSGAIFAGTENAQISNLEAARQICNLGIGLGVQMIGPEWAPRDKDEGAALVAGFKNYFDAKGQIQLSPEWGLALTVLAYSLPRLQHENTKSKLSKFGDWCTLKYVALRERFAKK